MRSDEPLTEVVRELCDALDEAVITLATIRAETDDEHHLTISAPVLRQAQRALAKARGQHDPR